MSTPANSNAEIVYIDCDLLTNTSDLVLKFATWVASQYGMSTSARNTFVNWVTKEQIFFLPPEKMYTLLGEAFKKAKVREGFSPDLSWDQLAEIDNRKIARESFRWEFDLITSLHPGVLEFLGSVAKTAGQNIHLVSQIRSDLLSRIASSITILLTEDGLNTTCLSCSGHDQFYVGNPTFVSVTLNPDQAAFWAKRLVVHNSDLTRSTLFTRSHKWALAAILAGTKTVFLVGPETSAITANLNEMLSGSAFEGILTNEWTLRHLDSLAGTLLPA